MRLIVMSDSHTAHQRVRQIVSNHPDAALFIHLGDGEAEFTAVAEEFPQHQFLQIRGNNDFGSQAPVEHMLDAGGVKIFCTHGHNYSVKWDLDELARAAKGMGAQLALYGHTHMAKDETRQGVRLINPGSVADSRVTPAGYLMLDITAVGMIPVFVKLDKHR